MRAPRGPPDKLETIHWTVVQVTAWRRFDLLGEDHPHGGATSRLKWQVSRSRGQDVSAESWARWIATHDTFDVDLRSDRAAERFLRRVEELGNDPLELLLPLGPDRDHFLRSLTWNLREALLEFAPPYRLRKHVVHLLPRIFEAACELGEEGAVFGFWDLFLAPWELRATWHFRRNVDPSLPLIEEVKEVLIRQLSMSNSSCLQQGALHGINHLADQATAERARAFVHTFSEETRQYSISALNFTAL